MSLSSFTWDPLTLTEQREAHEAKVRQQAEHCNERYPFWLNGDCRVTKLEDAVNATLGRTNHAPDVFRNPYLHALRFHEMVPSGNMGKGEIKLAFDRIARAGMHTRIADPVELDRFLWTCFEIEINSLARQLERRQTKGKDTRPLDWLTKAQEIWRTRSASAPSSSKAPPRADAFMF